MLDNLTYKRKFHILLGGMVLLSLFLVSNVFSKTFDLIIQNRSLTTELAKAAEAPKELVKLKAQIGDADQILQDQKTNDSITAHERILGIVSQYCHENKVTLYNYPEPNLSRDGEFLTETNIFTVQGSFKKILELIYLLEQKEKPGKIASVNFKSTKNFETQHIELLSTIYLQTFKKSHE
jgi:hypothetical protein